MNRQPSGEERQWCDAWAHIARGCEAGLTELDREHPRREEFLLLAADAHAAAGLSWSAPQAALPHNVLELVPRG